MLPSVSLDGDPPPVKYTSAVSVKETQAKEVKVQVAGVQRSYRAVTTHWHDHYRWAAAAAFKCFILSGTSSETDTAASG